MFRPTLLVAFALASTLAASPAHSQDINGTWRIASSVTPDGGSYDGTVTIRPNGDCYTVEWDLSGDSHYSGIGVRAGNVLAVAYSSTPGEDYGVVLYSRNKNGAFEGWWCEPNGNHGVENLSGSTLSGTHQLSGGTSAGNVRIESYGPGSLNFRLHWNSGTEEYDGFGTSPSDAFEHMAGVWGRVDGTGVVLYSLDDLANRKMPGWWAASVTGGQGLETLEK